MGAILGVILHAIGGFAAGTFYLPQNKIKGWKWETGWLILGLFAWIIMPWLVMCLSVPQWSTLYAQLTLGEMSWVFIFGMLWGIGGFTFGLSMRYLGMSLGMALALGLCAVFGTLIPPIYDGIFVSLLQKTSGQMTLLGIMVCVIGIIICGKVGMMKEKELDSEAQKAAIKEFSLFKGIISALIAGLLSACFAFGLAAGDGIMEKATTQELAEPLWASNTVLPILLLGGFLTNLVICLYLHFQNKSFGDYGSRAKTQGSNYFFAALSGIIWFLQFMFYGMGTSFLSEEFEFASWTLHMAFIIITSNLWGLQQGEWKGVSKKTTRTLWFGLLVIIISTVIIGLGSGGE